MQVFFTSQMTEVLEFVKAVDDKKIKERLESSNARTRDIHANLGPINYF